MAKKRDPKKGTGKKPKGSGRRLYTDENPKDTVKIKFATPADARATVAKVKRIKKPFARKIQILTVMEQRAKVMGKSKVVEIAKELGIDITDIKNDDSEYLEESVKRLTEKIKQLKLTYAWKWSHTPGQDREIVKGMILQSLGLSQETEKENGNK